jgi:hypothetical protein
LAQDHSKKYRRGGPLADFGFSLFAMDFAGTACLVCEAVGAVWLIGTYSRERNGMDVNFFAWLRNGVKQSVLLGVSDAIEDLGSPESADNLHPGVAALLRGEEAGAKRVGAAAKGTASRKRLGRSLKDIEPAT